MPVAIVRGTNLPSIQRTSWDFDPVRGYLVTQEFRAASQTQMLALQQDYVRLGIQCRLTYEQGDTATLAVEDATYAYTIDSWEIVGNEESRDALSHPTLWNEIEALGADVPTIIALMRSHLNSEDPPSVPFGTGGDLATYANTGVEVFYNLQLRGSTEYRRQQYVLRHKTNAPARWTVNIADFGIDQIYNTSQLLAEVQSSALWVFPLPVRMAYKLSNIPAPAPQVGYLWGWLKSASTETTSAHNRIDIQTEYTLEQWSLDYYAAYVGTPPIAPSPQ